jgi:predicted RNA-binding Zn-ribbon protein involved in translation (DUF1610 family)
MPLIAAPGYICPRCGYQKIALHHISDGGIILLDTDTGRLICSTCRTDVTSVGRSCSNCGFLLTPQKGFFESLFG